MRFGLDRMRRLMTALGSPQERFAPIHVVGTNGKSSTTRMIAAILAAPRRCAPAPTCRRTSSRSPSASASTTRDVDARGASRAAVAARRARRRARSTARCDADDRVTQFEALTAAAYARARARGASTSRSIEAGLGGRWDATNVIAVAGRRC